MKLFVIFDIAYRSFEILTAIAAACFAYTLLAATFLGIIFGYKNSKTNDVIVNMKKQSRAFLYIAIVFLAICLISQQLSIYLM